MEKDMSDAVGDDASIEFDKPKKAKKPVVDKEAAKVKLN
jgi:hypothetical protein